MGNKRGNREGDFGFHWWVKVSYEMVLCGAITAGPVMLKAR